MFMPFTIHLDPYLRKVIKEERSTFLAMQSGSAPNHPEERNNPKGPGGGPPPTPSVMMNPYQPWTTVTLPTPDQAAKGMFPPGLYHPKYSTVIPNITHGDYGGMLPNPAAAFLPSISHQLSFKPTLPARLVDKHLSTLSAEDVADLFRHLDGIRAPQVTFNLFSNQNLS